MIVYTQLNVIKAENVPIDIIINGKYLSLYEDDKPIIKNDRTFLPMDSIGEALNCTVEYSDSSKTVNVKKENMELTFPIGSNIAEKNGKKIELDVSSFIEKDRAFVPLRFIAESLNQEVQWDEKNQIILVGKYNEKAYKENTFIYTNEKYGYSINLPNSWKEEAILETKDGVLSVYDKRTLERFKQDGYTQCGPVFSIELNEYCLTTQIPGQAYVLDYKDGKYLEASFVTDVQFYPETQESYSKIYNEAKKALGSFKKLN